MADEVKKGIHDKVAALMQEISDEHGVVIRDISCEWLDVSSGYKSSFQLSRVTLNSSKRPE